MCDLIVKVYLVSLQTHVKIILYQHRCDTLTSERRDFKIVSMLGYSSIYSTTVSMLIRRDVEPALKYSWVTAKNCEAPLLLLLFQYFICPNWWLVSQKGLDIFSKCCCTLFNIVKKTSFGSKSVFECYTVPLYVTINDLLCLLFFDKLTFTISLV